MLTKYSVKKPLTILVAVVVVAVFGLVAVYKMTPELFPNINTPYAIVVTTYPGASAEEAEVQVTNPVEQQLATLSNIKNVISMSADNYSVVSLEFTDDVNMDAISVDIRDKLDQISSQLPESASTPLVMKINLDMMPVSVAAISMKDKTPAEVSTFVKENLQDELEGTEGVASINYAGMVDEGLQVVLSQEKINKINNKVSAAISSQFGEGESRLKSGISKAKSGSNKIDSAKDDIKTGQSDASQQYDSAVKQMRTQKSEAEDELETLEKIASPSTEQQEKITQLKATIKLLEDSIDQALSVKDSLSFGLGTTYSDASASQATLNSIVSQLQSSLSEIESQKKAAIDSADMTGVITMDNVSSILSAQNFSMPAGYVSDDEAKILVSVGDKIKDSDELKNLILFDMGIDGVDPIKLKDIGTVSYMADDSENYAKIDGENGILLSFSKQSTYATATVAGNINDQFEKLESEHKGLKFTSFVDQGEYINTVISSVFSNLLLGALFAILILLFFLRDIRPTVITAISIPVSLIFAVALMYFTGVTLNIISMSGLAIGVGMLVDNSIVVIENTFRLRNMGYSAVQAAVSGAGQVAGAITASTLTTICVFVPIVFVDGMTRELFTDLALTITYSLMASLLIALTFVPAVSKGLLKSKKGKTVLGQRGRVVTKYKRMAAWALLHKKRILIAALALLIASSGLLLVKGFEFMPEMSSNQISSTISMPEGSTLDDTIRVNDKISKEIRKIDGVESVGVMLASNMADTVGISGGESSVKETTMYILLDKDKTYQTVTLKKKFDAFAKKYDCEIITSANMDITTMLGGSGVSLNLYCEDIDTLRETAKKVEDELSNMKQLEDVSDIDEDSTDEIVIEVNKNTAMKQGLTVAQVYQQVAAKLEKNKTATTMTDEGGNTVDVSISNTKKTAIPINELLDMTLTVDKTDGSKEKVLLSGISNVKKDSSLNLINHDNQKRTVAVTAGVKDVYNITKVTADVKEMINEKYLIPSSVTIDYGGEYEEIAHSMQQMLLMMLVGIILVYLIMVAQFQSLRSPFIIIFTLPLAFTGGALLLLITNQVLSVIAMMGFVMLVGIVVNNGIVLVDCINRFRLEGMGMDEAIIESGAIRMRPVLMTATTTVLGLMPLALGIGNGAEMVQPVAITCIGGLIYATVTTLFIIPIFYKIFAKKHMEKIEEEELEILQV